MKKLISVLMILVLTASCAGALADTEWEDYYCDGYRFIIRKPADALAVYSGTRGYEGIWIYLKKPVLPPYVIVHRRPMERTIRNPEEYLNSNYREFLEEKYAESGVVFSPATSMKVGGKDLIGARCLIGARYLTGARCQIGDTVQLQLIEKRELGDVEYAAVFEPTDEEMVLEALDMIVASYTEDDTPHDDEYTDDFSYEDLTKEDWYEEHVEWWAEKRREAKEFTDHFTEKLTERDLLTFNIPFSKDNRYVLGETTLRDILNDGWFVFREEDGGFSLYDRYENSTGIYLYTGTGTIDEPVATMDAARELDTGVEYCGFDGLVGMHTNDPDENWYPDETGLKLDELLCETGERGELWDGLVRWLVTDLGARQNEEGIFETSISLSDGRTLYISSRNSQVRISLTGFE